MESRRRLAVRLLDAGHESSEVAELVDATVRSVQRWRLASDLAAVPQPGRPPKLSGDQAAEVVSWLSRSPTAFGFATERWTAPRVAAVLAERLGVDMNHRYLNDWLRVRGVTPQVPPRVPRERDEGRIAAWLAHAWPGIKKRRSTAARP